jgi:rare lipoprotein A
MHHATLRGYTVLGKRYYPQIVPIGWRESGVASWYGPDFHGKKTSSGETYDMYAPATAAHKTLPMNTIVLVTHRQSGAQVKVRVNDRGPFVQGRIIDLSYTAGKAIGLDITGTAPVTIEVLEYDRHISAKLGEEGGTKVAAPIESVIVPLEKVAVAAESGAGKYAIQLGSFKNIDGANRLKSSALMQGGHKAIQIKTVEFGSEKLHRVLIGGFDTKAEAEQYMKQIGFSNGVIVNAS